MHVGLYARVSTDTQEKSGTIATQTTQCRAFAANIGITGLTEYLDNGVSGMIELHERPAGKRLLADIKAGAIRHVIVYALDRIGRGNDSRLVLNAVYALRDLGCRVTSATEGIDLQPGSDDDNDDLPVALRALIASQERKRFLSRTRAGKARVARHGHHPGGLLSYGYRTNVKHEYIIDEEEAAIIRRMFTMADEGKTSSQIAAWLNSQGVAPRYARDGLKETIGLWHHTAVLKILHKDSYMGEHQYTSRGESFIVPYPAIVDKEQWDRVQLRLSSNQKKSSRNSHKSYLLRGLLVCPSCGRSMCGESLRSSKGTMAVWYRCVGRRSNASGIPGCNQAQLHGEWIEDKVWKICTDLLTNPPEEVVTTPLPIQADHDHSAEITNYQIRLNEIEAERERLIKLYTKGLADSNDVEKRLETLNKERKTLESLLQEVQRKPIEMPPNVNMFTGMLRNTLSFPAVEDIPDDVKRTVIEHLIMRVTVQQEGKWKERQYQAKIETVFGIVDTASAQ